MEGNMQEYPTEKKREKRLAVYTEKIQETVLNKSAETIRFIRLLTWLNYNIKKSFADHINKPI